MTQVRDIFSASKAVVVNLQAIRMILWYVFPKGNEKGARLIPLAKKSVAPASVLNSDQQHQGI